MQRYKRLKKDELIRSVEILSDTLNCIQATTAKHISTKYKKDEIKSAIHKKNLSYPFIPYDSLGLFKCSDNTERLIPTFALKGLKRHPLPEQDMSNKVIIGFPSHSWLPKRQ